MSFIVLPDYPYPNPTHYPENEVINCSAHSPISDSDDDLTSRNKNPKGGKSRIP